MNSNNIPKPEESLDELDMDEISSVDDFIRELEAKEKDLHITADLSIEIEESDFDEMAMVPDFMQEELRPAAPASPVAEVASEETSELRYRNRELQTEIDQLQKRIVSLREERRDTQEKSDRRLKDFENYKYRMDRERRGAFIDQIGNLATQMLPVLDNLDRALDSVEKSTSEKTAEFQQFYNGIVLVNQQVNEVLSEMGVQPILTVGEPFDPNFHEAVAVEEAHETPANMVLAEMRRGYRIGNRVIRHSMVKVSTAAANPAVSIDEVEASAEDLEILTSPASSSHDELPDLDPTYNGEDEVSDQPNQ